MAALAQKIVRSMAADKKAASKASCYLKQIASQSFSEIFSSPVAMNVCYI